MTENGGRDVGRYAPKQRQVVCTACRQSKVKCIGPSSDACERCARLGLDCFRDATYRRISKSRKIAELEKQVQQLSSVVNTRKDASYTPAFEASFSLLETPPTGQFSNGLDGQQQSFGDNLEDNAIFSTSAANHATSVNIPDRSDDPSPVHEYDTSGGGRPQTTMPQTLETVHLNPSQIDELFELFFKHDHPILPFLDPNKSADAYRNQPSLFWAIISVGSRRYRDDMTLLTALSEYVSKIIWNEISKPPYTVSTVQAIIILCTWPFPTTSTWSEPAVTLSSLAINIAMQLGLHRPMNAQDFLRTKTTVTKDELRNRTNTWAVANMVAQSLGAVVGHLPTAPFDWTVDQSCQVGTIYTLSEDLRFKLVLHRYCDKITKLMCGASNESMGFHSPSDRITFFTSWENDMQILEGELIGLDNEHRQQQQHVSDANQTVAIDQLYTSAARLYLHSFYFFDSSSPTRKLGILRAYNTACHFVTLLIDTDAESNILEYLSYYFFRILLTAACIILKVLASSYGDDIENYEEGKTLFNRTIWAMSRISVFNNDIGGKSIKLLAQVWHSSGGAGGNKGDGQKDPPELIIKSRLGASLTYDFIWRWRQEFGGVPAAYETPSANDGDSRVQEETSMDHFVGFFQDSSLVNLDFLDNPDYLGVEGGDSLI